MSAPRTLKFVLSVHDIDSIHAARRITAATVVLWFVFRAALIADIQRVLDRSVTVILHSRIDSLYRLELLHGTFTLRRRNFSARCAIQRFACLRSVRHRSDGSV